MILDGIMIGVFVVLGIGVFLPVYWAWSMILFGWRGRRVPPPAPDPCPKVAVILCLRGADPSLEACLHGLLHQDFPRYQLQIVVDNRADSAWQKVHDVLARGTPPSVDVRVHVLEKPCAACSLKVCAQLQIVERLETDVDIVALIDADSIPAADWLRALTSPLGDPKVGATSGIRWFAPVDGGWGSLIRHIFNAGSYPQMYAFDHAWGGSLAIRADLFRRSSLKSRWNRALCEDSAITGPLREAGLKLVFVPAVININFESIGFQSSVQFIQRQLLCVRLDHVDWPILLACNLFNVVAIVGLAILSGVGIALERWDWFGLGAGLLGAFAVSMYAALTTAEIVVRRIHRVRGLTPPPMVWTWRLIPAFFYTQYLCMKLLWRAHFLRRVSWRGIHYAVQGPGDIRLEKYEPYQQAEQSASSQHSAV